MGLYLSFVVARSVPDLARDNCFISNAPSDEGWSIHSSYVDILLEGVAKHAPELGAPAWYKNKFSLARPSSGSPAPDHFFEPLVILGDLERMQGIVAAHPQDFPTMHWLRLGNHAGIHSLDRLTSSLDIYHMGQPSTIFTGWDKVELRPGYPADSSQPPIDLTDSSGFTCRLRSRDSNDLDGQEVMVSIDRQPFGRRMARHFEAAYAVCRWAHDNSCLVIPWWG
jgi:hypothetical protein